MVALVLAQPPIPGYEPPVARQAIAAPAAAEVAFERVAVPRDAVGWAVADIVTVPEHSRRYQRYLWVPPWLDYDAVRVTNYAINLSVGSKARSLTYPELVANGWLLRYDLRHLAPKEHDLARVIRVWDSHAFDDPFFHVPQVAIDAGKDAIAAPHLDDDAYGVLLNETHSAAPILRADWFVAQALSTIDGGRYYDWMGYRRSSRGELKPGETELKALLADQGVDEELAKRVGGVERVAMFRSNVTGKPRRVDRFQGAGGRSGTGAVWVTRDIADDKSDVPHHPIYNLLSFQINGAETIYELPNGLHGFALTDNRDNLVDEVPPNLAVDHTIPSPVAGGPGTARLQSAISCIRCHSDSDGLKPAPNDVRKLLDSGLDVFDDVGKFGGRQLTREEAIDELGGLYGGDFTRRLRLGRDDYAGAIHLATKGMSPREAAVKLSAIYSQVTWQPVDAEMAAMSLGYMLTEGTGEALLAKILPPTKPHLNQDGLPVAQEDPTVGALKAGITVNVADWERVYFDAMNRTKEN